MARQTVPKKQITEPLHAAPICRRANPAFRFFVMKQLLLAVAFLLAALRTFAVIITVGPWTPVYQGVDLASGQQAVEVAGDRIHQVLCSRVDLQAVGLELFTTPHCTNACGLETLAENTSHFVETFGVQAAVNGGFYASSSGSSDSPLGTPDNILGLAISRGSTVSLSDDASYLATFLFTTNNQAFFVPTNSPPTNTAGIYTAISGNFVVLRDGVVVGQLNPSDLDPRTALGLSQDRRYLYMMTLDGRQPGWSDGADFYNTGLWLQRFGAYDGINIDGGGSTTMVMADCGGKAVRLNRSSFVFAYGRERNVGHNFGVRARALEGGLKDFIRIPGSSTAVITWRTEEAATTQVDYGPTTSYGSSTPLDGRLLKNHAVTLSGLTPGSNYFVRAISITPGGMQLTQLCSVTTIPSVTSTQLFGLTKNWTYNTNNFDGVNWKTNGFNDSGWSSGPGLLYVLEPAAYVAPRNTQMPPTSGTSIPRTYYFRTHFNFSGPTAGIALTFSNNIDDGAVFYLNGTEVRRVRMAAAPTAITYTSFATGVPCVGQPQQGDAATNCPDIFAISGNLLTNLVQGDNLLAVEAHNANFGGGTDLVFGSALYQSTPLVAAPRFTVWMENQHGTLFWNGAGFTLQQSTDLSSTNNWVNVTNAASPHFLTNPPTRFYRLKN